MKNETEERSQTEISFFVFFWQEIPSVWYYFRSICGDLIYRKSIPWGQKLSTIYIISNIQHHNCIDIVFHALKIYLVNQSLTNQRKKMIDFSEQLRIRNI